MTPDPFSNIRYNDLTLNQASNHPWTLPVFPDSSLGNQLRCPFLVDVVLVLYVL